MTALLMAVAVVSHLLTVVCTVAGQNTYNRGDSGAAGLLFLMAIGCLFNVVYFWARVAGLQ